MDGNLFALLVVVVLPFVIFLGVLIFILHYYFRDLQSKILKEAQNHSRQNEEIVQLLIEVSEHTKNTSEALQKLRNKSSTGNNNQN